MRKMILIGLVLLALPAVAAAQNCCMPSLGEEESSQRLIQGIQWATGALLLPPFAMVGLGVVWFCRVQRKQPKA